MATSLAFLKAIKFLQLLQRLSDNRFTCVLSLAL